MNRRPVAPAPKQRPAGTARTVILVAIFAVLAGLIIGRGLSNNSSGSGGGTGVAGQPTTAKTVKGATTAAPVTVAATTTTTVALGTFTAIVLNGNGIAGTAGARTTELGALGVKVAKAADATTKNFEKSAIYAVEPAAEAAARLLANKTGIGFAGAYPTSNPPAAIDNLGGATIVLLLGKDVANQVLSDKSAAAPTTVAGAAATTATATTVKA